MDKDEVNKQDWENFWLDHRLWRAPADNPNDELRAAAAAQMPPHQSDVDAPPIASSVSESMPRNPMDGYRAVKHIPTVAHSQAVLTADTELGAWIKLDRDDWERWRDRTPMLNCEPVDFDPNTWTQTDMDSYNYDHNNLLHEIGQEWANIYSQLWKVAEQIGWNK